MTDLSFGSYKMLRATKGAETPALLAGSKALRAGR